MPEWDADVRIAPFEVRAIVSAAFPAFRESTVRTFAEGWDNAAFLFDDAVLFRFPRRTIAVPLLEREIALLPLLAAQVPLAISVPQFVGRWRGDAAWPYAGYPLLTGTQASTVDLDDAARMRLAAPLGRFLRALHAVAPEPLVALGLPENGLARFDAERWAPKALDRARSIRRHGYDVPEAVLAWFERTRPLPGEQRVVAHGDLYARHVLLDDAGEPSGIIDWGDLHLGSPAIDLAVAHTMLPVRAHAAFREAYGPIATPVWLAARWRAIYAAILFLDFGIEADAADMRRAGEAALGLIARGLR